MCRLPLFPFLAMAAGVLAAEAETIDIDIGEWPGKGESLTPGGWTVNDLDLYKEDGGVTFNAVGDYAISPEYQGYVTQIVVAVCSSSSPLLRNLKAFPEPVGARTWTMDFTPEPKYVEQSFAWRVSEKVRRFRLQIEGVQSGNWRIHSLTVYLDRIEPPPDLWEDGKAYSDALPIRWTAESNAVSYEAEAARVVTVLPRYDLLKEWDFSSLTNASGVTTNFVQLADSPPPLDGVEGSELNLQGWAGGHLQIGKSDVAGSMRISLPLARQRVAQLKMFRHHGDRNGDIAVSYVGESGETNALARPVLESQPVTHVVSLPDTARTLVLQSRPSRRIRVENMKIVTGYAPGSVSTNVLSVVRTARDEAVFRRLAPGNWLWRVRSYDYRNFHSAWSPYRAVTLEADRPPFDKLGMQIIIR